MKNKIAPAKTTIIIAMVALFLLLAGVFALIFHTYWGKPHVANAPSPAPVSPNDEKTQDVYSKFSRDYTNIVPTMPENSLEAQLREPVRKVTGGFQLRIKPEKNRGWAFLTVPDYATQVDSSPEVSTYGGTKKLSIPGDNGFFRIHRLKSKTWLVDPEGYAFFSIGLGNIGFKPMPEETGLQARFGDQEAFVREAAAEIKKWGVTTAGTGSQIELLSNSPSRIPYLVTNWPGWSAPIGPLAAFAAHVSEGKKLSPAEMAELIFHPDFAAFLDQHAKALEAYRDDPWLLGYALDSGLVVPPKPNQPEQADLGPASALTPLSQFNQWRLGASKSSSGSDGVAWAIFVMETYLQKVTGAIRKYDPNHLIMAPEVSLVYPFPPYYLEALGRFCDCLILRSVNGNFPDMRALDRWSRAAGDKPFIISGFYAKGTDTAYRNETSTGVLVATQHDRGLYYQHFARQCLQSEVCVGWHWQNYRDDDPGLSPQSNRELDENSGILDISHHPYLPLVESMAAMNSRVYEFALQGNRQ